MLADMQAGGSSLGRYLQDELEKQQELRKLPENLFGMDWHMAYDDWSQLSLPSQAGLAAAAGFAPTDPFSLSAVQTTFITLLSKG